MKLTYEQEKNLTGLFLRHCGLAPEHADVIGEVVTHSDFTGVYSHGLSRFLMYVRQFRSGALNAAPDIRKTVDADAVCLYECDHASGIVAVNAMYEDVREKARRYGIAMGSGAHASNIGCGNYYGMKAAGDNMLCIFLSNTFPAMAPYGGADRLIGTNPIVMAVPSATHGSIVLDISTSNVAMGKIMSYRREDKAIPLGWANDVNGLPTEDPHAAYAVTPIGAYKGYGLAVFVDLIGAVLSGSAFGSEIPPVAAQKHENTGFALILADIDKLMPIDAFKKRVDEYADMMKNSRKAEGFEEIYMPGEIEQRKYEANRQNGIDLSDATWTELERLGREIGLLAADQPLAALL